MLWHPVELTEMRPPAPTPIAIVLKSSFAGCSLDRWVLCLPTFEVVVKIHRFCGIDRSVDGISLLVWPLS
eukprot:3286341-Pyramimonas_sp.AAC.1